MGEVTALVQGSGKKPYNVRVRIDELTEEQYESIVEKCASKIQNIDDLVKGNFPDDLKTLFTQKGAGLFPSMAKIHFNCSCPDYADMCKHVAAVLYGIGSRFGKDPLLFFKLRGVDTDRLIGNAIKDRIQSMIENAAKPSDRIMDDGDVMAVFGMEVLYNNTWNS
ncbi:MAG: SWIM zinc finger family protein [Treponema sp.]|nr:SWIM zinc finger family protein [Treponema sp.]